MRACFFGTIFVHFAVNLFFDIIVNLGNSAVMRGCLVFMRKNADFAK